MRSNVGEVIAVGRNMEWGTEGMGLYECSVPVQTIRKEFYCLLDKRGILEGDFFGSPGRKKANHSPGMHLMHSWTV